MVKRAGSVDDRDLLSLEKPAQSLPQVVDDGLLPGLTHRKVDFGFSGLDAEARSFLHRPKHRGGFEKLLGRDTTAVQTRAPNLVAFDDGAVESSGGGIQRSCVASRSATNYNEIKMLSRRNHPCV